MLKTFLLRILSPNQKLTTYSTGLLHAKAYRALKHRTQQILEPYHINSLDWALLGVLFDQKEGFKLTELSELLGIEAPFTSVMVGVLEEKKLVKRISSTEDKRAKTITLTEKGRELVPVIETDLKSNMKELLNGASSPAVYGYLKVLAAIVRNSQDIKS